MNKKRVYFDNAATGFPKPRAVAEAVCDYMTNIGSSISRGGYDSAYAAEERVFETRGRVMRLLGGSDESRVIFTCNVTTALNTVIKGIIRPGESPARVCISPMEHNAVVRPLSQLRADRIVLPSDEYGRIDVERAAGAITKDTRMVIVSHASNVTGVVQPIARIGEICREKGVLFVVDAAQSAGVLNIITEAQNIDILCWTGHKALMGPQGTGGLVLSEEFTRKYSLEPLIAGGTGSSSHLETMPAFLPDALEAGTPNLPGIYGLGEGLRFIEEVGTDEIRGHENRLAGMFENSLKGIEGVRTVGRSFGGAEYTGVVSVVFEKIDQARAAFMLDSEYGIETRVGLHCAPLAHRHLGTYPQGTVRFSFGYFNTEEEISYGVEAVRSICKRG